MDDFGEEETEFVVEEVTTLVKECIEKIASRETFQRQKCEIYVNRISEAVISALARLNKPFKYIVTVEVAQNDGCGRHGAFANLWDAGRDKCCNIIWKNEVMLCIVNVIGLHI